MVRQLFSLLKFIAFTSMLCECSWALRCEDIFASSAQVYQSYNSHFRTQDVTIHQLQGSNVQHIMANQIAPEISEDRKIIIGFFNGHVYLHHNGKKADSWGRPPFRVSAKPKQSNTLTGQFFVVLNDKSGEASNRFTEVFQKFEGKNDFTCVRLACQFMSELYPEAPITKQITPEQFLEKVLKWQSPETYSAEIYVTGTENFDQALKAQKTNQLKTVRNAAIGVGVGLGLPFSFIYALSQIIF